MSNSVILWGIVVKAFNPPTGEAEARGSLGLKSACSTRKVPEQSELHRETLFENKQVKVETNYL